MSKYGDVKITQLRRSSDLAKTILEVFSADQLEEFADDGICPHYVIVNPKTGKEMFKLFHSVEVNDWIHSEIVHYKKGLTEPVKIYLNNIDPSEFYPKSISDVPEELKGISGLMQIPVSHTMEMPGVYFLCKEKSIVYIGKSVNVFQRLVSHRSDPSKDFDSVYCINVPPSQLEMVESSLIKFIKPPLNGDNTKKNITDDHKELANGILNGYSI